MCYVIELMDKYLSTDSMTLTFEKNVGIKMDYVKWTMTSDHDYLVTTTHKKGADFMPIKFTSFFGAIMNQKITTVQTLRYPLKCKKHNPDYV